MTRIATETTEATRSGGAHVDYAASETMLLDAVVQELEAGIALAPTARLRRLMTQCEHTEYLLRHSLTLPVETVEGCLQVLRSVVNLIKPVLAVGNPDTTIDAGSGTTEHMSPAEEALLSLMRLPSQVPKEWLSFCSFARSVLLYGPPGTGKTRAVRRISDALSMPLVTVSAGDLLTRWVGGSEARLRRVFRWARDHAPCILFFDEMDALFSRRSAEGESEIARRIKTELLGLIQDVTDKPSPFVYFIAATNMPWDLDPALRRRFHEHIHVVLPDAEEMVRLVDQHVPVALRDPSVAWDGAVIALAMQGMSRSEVVQCCRSAVRRVIAEHLLRHRAPPPTRTTISTTGGTASPLPPPQLPLSMFIDVATHHHRASSDDDIERFTAWSCHA